MFDERGRLWYTARIRAGANPRSARRDRACLRRSSLPSSSSGRQLAVYDPATKQISMIDTCFGTHHLLFAEDANNTLWTSSGGGGGVVGWLNTKMWDQTHDAAEIARLDRSGAGHQRQRQARRLCGRRAESGHRAKRRKSGHIVRRQRASGSHQGHAPQRSVLRPCRSARTEWCGARVLGFPGGIVRLNPGSNPPETALAEYYEVPWNDPKAPVWGFSPRGMDVDRNGVAWVALASGHLASFDRRKCKGPLNGPNATGQHCPEGWTLYQTPGPKFKNVTDSGSADSHYYDLGRSVRYAGAGQEHAHRHRQFVGFAACPGQRQVRHHARALSAGLLCQGHGWPHRRSEGGLEGQRSLDHLGHAHALP